MTLSIAGVTLLHLDHFNLVELFMQREGLSLSVFTILGAAWIGLSVLVFVAGDFAARLGLGNRPTLVSRIDFESCANVVFLINLILILVTAFWILLSAQRVGGIFNLVSMAYLDSLGARDLLLGNKLFTGMRLFYAALPVTGCCSVAILTATKGALSRRATLLCISTIVVNTIALFVLPVVMSQRLLLLQFLLSAFLVSCLIRRKIIGAQWIALAVLIFLTTWVLRESVTNPLINASALDISFQKLAFYFVNDLWNGFAPLQADTPYTLGAISLRGITFLTFTESIFSQSLALEFEALDSVLGGGHFPFFTAAFVDFGSVGGALFIFLCAIVFRTLFHFAHQGFFFACVYAQLGAALLFSTHGIYFTHQNFLFSIAILGAIKILSHKHPQEWNDHAFGAGNA